MVVPPGLEPELTVSKTAVLPLHHGTISGEEPCFYALKTGTEDILNSVKAINKKLNISLLGQIWVNFSLG